MSCQGAVFGQRELNALTRPCKPPKQTKATRAIERQRIETQSFIHTNSLLMQKPRY
jgi:hypothetical protein